MYIGTYYVCVLIDSLKIINILDFLLGFYENSKTERFVRETGEKEKEIKKGEEKKGKKGRRKGNGE